MTSILSKYKNTNVLRPDRDRLARATRKFAAGVHAQIALARDPEARGHRWTFRTKDGFFMNVKYGRRNLEFPEGTAFELEDEGQVIPFLQDVLRALDAGELDEALLKAATLGHRHPERWHRDGRRRRRCD